MSRRSATVVVFVVPDIEASREERADVLLGASFDYEEASAFALSCCQMYPVQWERSPREAQRLVESYPIDLEEA